MNDELASHISLLAAPLYAAFLAQYGGLSLTDEQLTAIRRHAIEQALALWQQTRETKN